MASIARRAAAGVVACQSRPARSVVAERRPPQKLVHVDVGLVLADRRLEQGRTVRIVYWLDRRGQRELLDGHSDEIRQPLDRASDAVLDLALPHPPGEPATSGTPARIEQLPVRIERTEQRRHGDHMRVAQGGDELGGLAVVRRAKDTDPAVRPRLRCHPVDQVAIVSDLTRAELHRARAERRASAASVGDDERETGAGPQLPSRMVTVILGLRTRRLLGPVVARGPERRTDTFASGDPLNRKPDVDGQPYAVGDRHVE